MKNSGGICIPRDGYYVTTDLTAEPKRCNENCSACLGTATHCKSCDATRKYMLDTTRAKCICTLEYYMNSNKVCTKCNPKCAICSNTSDCVRCKG